MYYAVAKHTRYLVLVACGCAAVLWCASGASAAVTITVNEGERHKFEGFGSSVYKDGIWNTVPEDTRMEMVNHIYGDLNFQFIRVWAGMEHTANSTEGTDAVGRQHQSMVELYSQYIEDVQKVQPDVILLLGPCAIEERGHASTPFPEYVDHFVTIIQELREEHGIRFDVSGVMNEPNAQSRLNAPEVPQLVKLFRNELDARGLSDVGLIAPECWGVDGGCLSMFDALLGDAEAVDALVGFGTHCYSHCITKDASDWFSEYDKQHWETESSKFGPEAAVASLAGINLGITHWAHFFAFFDNTSSEAYALISYDKATGDYAFNPSFYYYKQLSSTLTPGTVMRQCYHSSIGWMQLSGSTPSQSAAAGVRPDGRIAMAVANIGGATDVTFVFEELEGGGDKIDMEMHRVADREIQDAGTVVLDNGRVGVNVGSQQLVTLCSVDPFFEPTAAGRRQRHAGRRGADAAWLECSPLSGHRGARISFSPPAVSAGNGEAVRITVHGLDGSRVAVIADRCFGQGISQVSWNGSGIAGGAYIVRLTSDTRSAQATFFMR